MEAQTAEQKDNTQVKETKAEVTILFAGDSGDGIQLTGSQFTNTAALYGNDISTFPNFPAEIRAPQGTLAGVSGFQVHFGSVELFTPGDEVDVLVVMNAAALKVNLNKLKVGGIIIANTDGFDKKNLKLSGQADGDDPLDSDEVSKFKLYRVDVTKMTRAALEDSGLGTKEKDQSKNMFVLGFIYWMYSRKLDDTLHFLETKFAKKPAIAAANSKVLKAGFHYGETSETFTSQYEVKPAPMPKGVYRNIMGNQATAIGMVAAAKKSGLELFYGSYPITPASDILHELAKHKNFGVKTFQAEDEIAAVCTAIGASFGGALGATASSGPGIALKMEAIGLAAILEVPLLVVNVQRGGPSTGLPTKTEQADLMQVLFGRNGEAPVPVIAAKSPSDCFDAVFEATRIAIEHMTPVFYLSDGYIANGSEAWKFPSEDELKTITPPMATPRSSEEEEAYLPYLRDEKLVRKWAIPGMKGLEHRIGGIEKEDLTGNISYDPDNHQKMVKIRAEKVEKIAQYIPEQEIDNGPDSGELLILGWGSTYGAIKTAVRDLHDQGVDVAHAHLRYLNPLPRNLGEMLKNYKRILIPEMNNGQLIHLIRSQYLIDAKGLNKIKGIPFTANEIAAAVKSAISNAK